MIKKNNLCLYISLIAGMIAYITIFDLTFNFVGITFLLLCLQSIAFLTFLGKDSASLVKVYFSFICIFFSLVPWLHYSHSIIFWGGKYFTTYDYILTNFLIFLSNMLFIMFYLISKNRKAISTADKRSSKYLNITEKILLLSISYTALFLLLLYNNFNFIQLFFRGHVLIAYEYITDSQEMHLITENFIRLIPLFCFFYAVIKLKRVNFFSTILLISLIVSVFPTGVPRYLAGAVYVTLILFLFSFFRNGTNFTLMIFSGILFIFPFLNQFREFYSIEYNNVIPTIDFFLAEHFDAYQNLVRAIQIDFITYGNQLLGVILFFVPRAFWNQKPFGSGHEMAHHLDYIFDNISMPYLAEGYVNYGIMGLLLFTIIIGYAFGKLDKKYYFQIHSGEINYSGSIYLYLIGSSFFLLRGDLMSSFAYMTGGLLSAALVYLVMKFPKLSLSFNK